VAGLAHRSFSDPPETFSQPFYPLCPWIHGLFPATEFAVAPSSPLPISDDPGATLACACLNASDFTAAERSGAARSRLFTWPNPLRPIQIKRLEPRVPLRARAPDALSRVSVPPAVAHSCRSDFPRTILIERLRPPRTPPRPILIERLGPPRTHVAVRSPLWRWARFVSALSPSVANTPCPACQRSPARARALGRRSNLGRWFLI
jgi:hypothetical protein